MTCGHEGEKFGFEVAAVVDVLAAEGDALRRLHGDGRSRIAGVPDCGRGRPVTRDYAESTGPSGTRQANPHPFGVQHTLRFGSAVPHSVSVLPHSGQE